MYCFLFWILFHIVHTADASSITCGGFLKSSANIDYSRIAIKLYTSTGTLKYTSDCAPNNGYFFIPIYDKGQYMLRVDAPAGWKFEPNSVELNIDGTSDQCSLSQDINFIFKGFTVEGQVLSNGLDTGPKGVEVTIKDKKDVSQQKSTKTDSTGKFFFEEVLPGTYEMFTDPKKYKYLGSNSLTLEVVSDNLRSTPKEPRAIIISGYSLSGRVTSDGEPIRDVHFALFSLSPASKSLPQGCDQSPIKVTYKRLEEAKKKGTYLCYQRSNNDGSFEFENLSPGKYRLIALYIGNNIEFEVKPPLVDFEIKHAPLRIKEEFRVEGFSVKGRVLTQTDGQGIPGARIVVKDERGKVPDRIIESSNDGGYFLENMRAGSYSFHVTAPRIKFESKKVKISPASPQIPDIVASSFETCGTIKFRAKAKQLQINFSKLEGSNYVNREVASSGNDGSFCAYLASGRYRIFPVTKETDKKELIFSPKHLEVDIVDKPILNLIFRQFAASIKGNVILKDVKASARDIRVTLIDSETQKQVDSVVPDAETKNFQFATVFPGKYVINISKDKNTWCWKTESVRVAVEESDITGIKFEQEGFILAMVSSHPVEIEVEHPKFKEIIQIVEAQHSVVKCLPESGTYKLNPVSCHVFVDENGKRQPFSWTTSSSKNNIILRASEHQLTGSAQTIVPINTTDDFSLTYILENELGEKKSSKALELVPRSKSIDSEGNVVKELEFTLSVSPGFKVLIESHSKHLLFKPSRFEIVMPDDCHKNAVQFKARMGVFVKGRIIPPLEGVVVKLYRKKTDEFLSQTVSGADGSYSGGPFDCCENTPVSQEITVRAEKEGYLLKESTKFGDFASEKLSSLELKVVSITGKEETPLQGVLISISGGSDNFRRNSITPENGELAFFGLSPGQYFMRAVLKEYKFEPSSQIIDVSQGKTIQLKVKGNRIAYSCFGTSISLSGQPESSVLVGASGVPGTKDASGTDCSQYQEEGVSESNGVFRIRDLKPGCRYRIALKKGSDGELKSRCLSEYREIEVGNQDISGIKLLLVPSTNVMEIAGDILTSPEFWPSLRVKLFSDYDGELIASVPITSAFFSIPSNLPRDDKAYTLRLESTLPSYSYAYDLPSISFKANTSYHHFQMSFNPRKLSQQDTVAGEFDNISGGSMFLLPLIVILVLGVYNHEMLLSLYNLVVENVSSWKNSLAESRGSSSPNNDQSKERRKIKARRA
ncbi:BOS complex subunit NOMO3 [Brevipalpus obovatus]|uniref:BOS complex subunit NOMO3 n=1 Tax=Brevipalpus obovatus TaxID=246614 RepID=UPI003D9EEAF5